MFRKAEAPSPINLLEIVTPRTNAATAQAAENFLAAMLTANPFSLEIAATATARRFLARTNGSEMGRHVAAQLAVAYPQATLRPLCLANLSLDPGRPGPGDQVAAYSLRLRGPVYLPIRHFGELDPGECASQADPILGILGALDQLPDGWRALSQLVLRPAPDDWARPFLRLALEHPLEAEWRTRPTSDSAPSSDPTVTLLAGLLVLGALGLQSLTWYDTGNWLDLALLAGGGLTLAGGIGWLMSRGRNATIYDPRLVAEKINRSAFVVEPRLAVFAPWEENPTVVRARLDRLVAAYRQYAIPAGNGFVACPLSLKDQDLSDLRPFGRHGNLPILTTRELAGLWHLPSARDDVPLVERTTARERLPLPATVDVGCRIGIATHQGRTIPVSVPDEILQRHLLLVAKTRRGKSSLLLCFATYLMRHRPDRGAAPAVILVDPHRDLAGAALGLVPEGRRGDVVFLDVADDARPFGLNLLDVGLGWDRDKAVANALTVFKREFSGAWGFRMEDAFRYGLNTLYEANVARCAVGGRDRQYTVLHLPTLLTNAAFQRALYPLLTDPFTRTWWDTYYRPLDRRYQLEVVNPVQTKIQRFAGTRVARNLVGQSCSTIDPRVWIREGKIVIVNLAKGTVGENTAALLGGTLLNLIALAIAEQAELDPTDRRPVRLLVDEFQSVPGADFEAILSELAKFGASLTLATQSLARLDALDREHQRALRETVFANLDGLFAFHCSAEDARYLVPELGADVDEEDLVALGEHRCYARLSARGERLPTFSVHLELPPSSDPLLAVELADQSARHYGRECAAVEEELRTTIERIRHIDGQVGSGDADRPQPAANGAPNNIAGPASKGTPRNQYRNRRKPSDQSRQASFLQTSGDADVAPATEQEERDGDR